jgi:hypothetical protein
VTDRIASERGMSVVEVVIAAMLLIIGALAVLGFADTANRTTYRAEQGQVVVDRLQAEMEKLRQLTFDEVALTSAPPVPADPDLASRLSAGNFRLNRDGTDPRPLAVAGGTTPSGAPVGCGATGEPSCAVDPGPVDFDSGDVHGKIYRYVVYPGVPSGCGTGCTQDDLKRIVVAIKLDDTASGGARAYQELQSDVSSTRDREGALPPPPPGPTGEIAQFWLTDTPCSSTTRQPVADDPTGSGGHNTHNTRGVCTDGRKYGSAEKGAPDLMFNEGPAEAPGGGHPYLDYSADLEPGGVPTSTDKGLQMLKPTVAGATGCLLAAPTLGTLDLPLESSSTKHTKSHIWLSNELEPSFRPLTTSTGTLELFTRTAEGAGSTSGKVCFWVFKRVKVVGLNLLGIQVTHHIDIPGVITSNGNLLYGHKTLAFWPGDWKRTSIPFNVTFANVTNYLGSLNLGLLGLTSLTVSGQPRLGLALQIEQANTTGSGLQFMYDHPDFASRLELQTPTCIILCS